MINLVAEFGGFFSSLLQGGLSGLLGTLAVTLLCVCVFCSGRLLARHAWFTHRLSCFSTPPTHSWLLGHLGQMKNTEEGLQEVDALVETYRHSCSWFLGPFYHMVRVFHPDFTKPLLMASASITVKDELFYGFLRPWLGQSVLLSVGEEWSRRRRLLTPAFHFDVLKNYITVFNTSTNTLHAKWHRLLTEGSNNMEMFHHISLMTLDSLLKCAFSYNSNCQESSCEYVSAIEELGELIIARRQKILHHWDWIYWRSEQGRRFRKAADAVHGFTRGIVQQRRAIIDHWRETENEPAITAHRKKDFIDIVLMAEDDEGVGLTDEEIQAEADTFMFAGHDTTSSAICWTLYNLACHGHYQDRCRQEVTELLSGRQEQEIQWDDLSSLPFTTMCIRESLRLHSPVSAVTRQYTQDMSLPGDRIVPQGTICLVSIYGSHRNPVIWTDPKEFDPLRFDPANARGRNPHAFIPFSTGPRNCIGQKFAIAELRVVVALTLLRFRLSPGVNPDSGATPGLGAGVPGGARRLPQVVLRAEGGLWLQLDSLTPPDQDAPHQCPGIYLKRLRTSAIIHAGVKSVDGKQSSFFHEWAMR